MMDAMDSTQQECFRLYVEMGDGRNIPKLHKIIEKLNMGVTLRMLQRYCIKYRWNENANKTAAVVAQRVEEVLVEDGVTRARKLINGLRQIQDRFITKIALDPLDPTLTDAQKLRAIDPDFRDFQDAVKLERLILGDPTERREDVTVSRIQLELGESELLEAARLLASKRYGLPTDQEIRNVTERHTETVDA
jgi:hypothetical protein